MQSAILNSIAHPGRLLLLWFAGLYLRIPVLVAPPLAPKISAELGLNQAATGALTTLPALMLSIGAVLGSLFVAKLGVRQAVIVGLALAAAASAARGLAPPATVLFVATALMGVGIAIMQPAMAALASAWFPGSVALAVGVYMNGMYSGEFLSAGVTQTVVLPLAGGSWHWTLLLWSLPVLPILAGLRLCAANSALPERKANTAWPDWRNKLMWKLGLLISASSVLFLGTNAYMADIIGAQGQALQHALFWFNLSQIVSSLIMLTLARRLVARRVPLILTSLIGTSAGAFFVFWGGPAGLVAAFILGMCSATQLTLVIMAAPYLAPPNEAARVSAGIFVIGYSIAFTVPLISGLFAQILQKPWMAMLPMLVYAAATFPLALNLRLTPFEANPEDQ